MDEITRKKINELKHEYEKRSTLNSTRGDDVGIEYQVQELLSKVYETFALQLGGLIVDIEREKNIANKNIQRL